MQTTTVLLIILAALGALSFAIFQYHTNIKKRSKLHYALTLLRFLSIFGILLLLINPEFSKTDYSLEKTNLIVLTDNSSSMKVEDEKIAGIIKNLEENSKLNERFKLQKYVFGASLTENQNLNFTEKKTNIASALSAVNEIYKGSNTAIVLLTDGNQTLGRDYAYLNTANKMPIYPIALGDTTAYEDIKIDQVNSNKYAFLKNKFPIETYISYQGKNKIRAKYSIKLDGKTVFSKDVNLSPSNTSTIINASIQANSVGLKAVTVGLTSLEKERNTINNSKQLAIEVIDEKTRVAIVSEVLHPDLGTLKKAIESNRQRTVVFKKPTDVIKSFEEFDVFILYQPTRSFKSIFDFVKQKKAGLFAVVGTNSDLNFLNRLPTNYGFELGYPVQEVRPERNSTYSSFDISNFKLDDFPPLSSDAGPLANQDYETLLYMNVLGRTTQIPLLLSREEQNVKEIVLLGENIWKWRMQSYRNENNFENFDEFIGKLMLYLSSNNTKSRLNIDYNRIYDGATNTKITASYFDESFVFNPNANISMTISNTAKTYSKTLPMLLKNEFYEFDVVDLPAADYNFTVKVKDENRSKSGSFTVLDFDVEQQLLTTDYKKLEQLAIKTKGQLYYPDQLNSLLTELNQTAQFLPTQKSIKNIVSLIDFRILLALIMVALAAEWFIRKYNGLI